MFFYDNVNTVCSEAKELIYEYGKKISCKKGDLLISPYTKMENLFFIDRGRFRYLCVDKKGNNHILRIEESNSFIALAPIITSRITHQINIIAETDSIVYKISKDSLQYLIDSSKNFRDCILETLAIKELNSSCQFHLLTLSTNKEKVYHFLAQCIDNELPIENGWHYLKYNYNQQDIADVISSTKTSVWKVINELCEENLLRIVNKKIQVRLDENMFSDINRLV